MANWYNARLLVAGRRPEVLEFIRVSRAQPSALFEPDMRRGEGGDLTSERLKTLEPGFAAKKYSFQIRNDDGHRHFRRVSRKFPALCFVLVYFSTTDDSCGSFFIFRGRVRSYAVPVNVWEATLEGHRHGVIGDFDADNDALYWEASWEVMDLAEAQWQKTLIRAIHS